MSLSKTAHIIGGGPSAAGIPFQELSGTLIGVNDSFFNAPCQCAVSIDGRWMKHRYKRLKEANSPAWLRRDSFLKHVGLEGTWPALELGECKIWEEGIGETLEILHGNNSGLVALNFAYVLGFQKIFLYGFDMGFEGPQKHWYPDYEWAAKGNHMYPAFSRQFDGIADTLKAKGIQVINVSPTSKLECFERISYDQVKNYL